jgi:Arc/MetJ-type ribon-helix-helix transcriptional regulator
LVRNSELTEHGVKQMRDLVVKYSFGEVADAMRVAVGQYVEKKGPQHALDKIQGICKNRRIEAKHPWMREANHATNIMLKKFDWLRRWRVLADASEAINAGVCADIVLECARSAASPREWENGLRGEIRMAQMPGGGA